MWVHEPVNSLRDLPTRWPPLWQAPTGRTRAGVSWTPSAPVSSCFHRTSWRRDSKGNSEAGRHSLMKKPGHVGRWRHRLLWDLIVLSLPSPVFRLGKQPQRACVTCPRSHSWWIVQISIESKASLDFANLDPSLIVESSLRMWWMNTDAGGEHRTPDSARTEAARGHVRPERSHQALSGPKLNCLYGARKTREDSNYIPWVTFTSCFPRMIFLVILLKLGCLRQGPMKKVPPPIFFLLFSFFSPWKSCFCHMTAFCCLWNKVQC